MKPNRKMIDARFLILLLGVAGYPGKAQPAGTFTPTGSMITPRSGHTATLLFNGKVLIAAGALRLKTRSVPSSAGATNSTIPQRELSNRPAASVRDTQ
jgi:hypothetical protein